MVLKKKETADQKLIKMLEASSGSGTPSRKIANRSSEPFDPIELVKKLNLLLIVGVLVAAGFLVKEVMSGMALAKSPVSASPLVEKNHQVMIKL